MRRPRSAGKRAVLRAGLAALATAAALGITACGSDDPSGDTLTVAATTGILTDFTKAVAGGDASVDQIVPNASSPHDFQLSAEDRKDLEDAELIIENGEGLEAGLPLDEVDAPRFVLTEHVGELLPFAEGDGGGSDPHVWMDPTRLELALPALADALAKADPDHAEGYRERAEGYATALDGLDTEITQRLSTIPPQNREFVTSHDSLGYFADHFGFRVVAAPFPASGPEAEPSAQTIKDVAAAVRKSKVPAVFATEEDDPEVLELIADETGVEVVTDLLVESPGSAGTYVDMMRRDADVFTQHLGG